MGPMVKVCGNYDAGQWFRGLSLCLEQLEALAVQIQIGIVDLYFGM